MANNYVQPGEVIEWTNGGSAVVSGQAVLMTARLGVALEDIANGAAGQVAVSGVYTLPKLSTDTPAQGAPLYWDAGNGHLTTTASTHKQAGYAFRAAGSGVTQVDIKLNA